MQDKRSVNLCSVYMLPLVGLNQSSFGIGNFINSYVNETNEFVVVELQQMTSFAKAQTTFKFNFSKDNKTYCVYEIPQELKDTVELFRKGKYSQFSKLAKETIIKKSGLRFNAIGIDGKPRTAKELLALERAVELRQHLEKELGVKLETNAELASIPDDSNFYELQLSNELVN